MWYLNDYAKPDVNYPENCSNPSGVYLLSRATVLAVHFIMIILQYTNIVSLKCVDYTEIIHASFVSLLLGQYLLTYVVKYFMRHCV